MNRSEYQPATPEITGWVDHEAIPTPQHEDLFFTNEDGPISGNVSTNGSTADEHSGSNDFIPGHFEGPEKTMEVVFRNDKGPDEGLRTLTREQLDFLCTKAKCTIVHKISNSYQDAYILSESSLFIYKHRLVMKTCGTTTLLRCLGSLLEFADKIGMEFTWVGYSRKNLLYPSAQLWPHSSFGDEIRYIQTHEKLQDRLNGVGYILGPITGDHWFVYVADHSETSPLFKRTPAYIPPPPSNERTINMMMFDMAPEIAQIFYQANTPTGKEMTYKAGIHHLCPGAMIDEMAFSPCGYSMNAILHDAYSTIHITPEPQCSYVSFETNTMLENYNPMVRNVLTVFKPRRFVLTMFGDQAAIDGLKQLPTDVQCLPIPGFGTFTRTSVSSTKVDQELCCMMACYSLQPGAVPGAIRSSNSQVGLDVVDNVEAIATDAATAAFLKKERCYTWC